MHTCAHQTPQDLCRGWGCRIPPLPEVSPPGYLQMGHCMSFQQSAPGVLGWLWERGRFSAKVWPKNRSEAITSERLLSSARPGVGEAPFRASHLTSCAPSSFPHYSPFAWQGPGRYCLCPRVQRTPHREPQGSEDLGLSRLWVSRQVSAAETLALWGHSCKSGPTWPDMVPRLFYLEM